MISSPVTGLPNVSVLETIGVHEIIHAYRKNLQIDVSRFFENVSEVCICRCGDSGYRFYYPASIFGDESFYQLLQQRPGYYSTWNWEHGEAVKHFPDSSNVLEIGCGTGNFLKRIQSSHRVAGLELNKSAIAVARAGGVAVYDELIEEHAGKYPEAYDIVCAFQVFEHIYEVKPFVEAALKCLKPGGKLVLGVPNNNPYLYKYDRLHTLNLPPHHAGLWDIASLKKLPEFFGMKNTFLLVEPLYEYTYFAHQLKSHLTETRSLFRFIPVSVLGVVTKMLKRYIQGRNLLVGYQKT